MKRTLNLLLYLLLFSNLYSQIESSVKTYFPYHIGDLWQYRYTIGALAWTERIDSIFVDTNRIEFVRFKRFYNDGNYTFVGWYVIKDSNLVYEDLLPRIPTDAISKLLYKLNAQIGEVWKSDPVEKWIAKVVTIDSKMIFGKQMIYKEISYGRVTVNSDTIWWNTRTLAQGFGLIDAQLEPMAPVYLNGTIIGGVQWGFIVNVHETAILPDEFILRQNFPNPFNPTTTISFSIPKRLLIRMKVFDVLGRELAILFEGYKEKGTHVVLWNASLYSSGIYFYRLETEEGILTKKLILTK